MVASILTAPLFDGPSQPLVVAHRSSTGCQLLDQSGRATICVTTADSVRLPHAVVVASFPSAPSSVSVGDGALEWDGTRVPVTRWWTPARPCYPSLRPAVNDEAARLLAASWASSLGRGSGLTPYDDDVLSGSLVALHAAGHPVAASIAAHLDTAELERHTTAISAALLRHAAHGWCIDELADHVAGVARWACGTATEPASSAEETALRKVGHSSGRGMVEGVGRMVRRSSTRHAA